MRRRRVAAIAEGIAVCAVVGAVLLYRIMTFKMAGLIWVAYLHVQKRPGR